MYYLVRNYEPMKDPAKPVIKKLTDLDKAVRYAQNLEAVRVDVIAVPDNGEAYLLKHYPLNQ
ncbi:MAG: hypothetical protein KGJ13_02040 [Patescibacteria group bacterium]|nr:hypothetical protein [Patescibacteria group bacterium]